MWMVDWAGGFNGRASAEVGIFCEMKGTDGDRCSDVNNVVLDSEQARLSLSRPYDLFLEACPQHSTKKKPAAPFLERRSRKLGMITMTISLQHPTIHWACQRAPDAFPSPSYA